MMMIKSLCMQMPRHGDSIMCAGAGRLVAAVTVRARLLLPPPLLLLLQILRRPDTLRRRRRHAATAHRP
jgi:hypothetical protein